MSLSPPSVVKSVSPALDSMGCEIFGVSVNFSEIRLWLKKGRYQNGTLGKESKD